MSDYLLVIGGILTIAVLVGFGVRTLGGFVGRHGLPLFTLFSSLAYFVLACVALAACGLVWFFHAISQVQT